MLTSIKQKFVTSLKHRDQYQKYQFDHPQGKIEGVNKFVDCLHIGNSATRPAKLLVKFVEWEYLPMVGFIQLTYNDTLFSLGSENDWRWQKRWRRRVSKHC
jgi:hypothetical protein